MNQENVLEQTSNIYMIFYLVEHLFDFKILIWKNVAKHIISHRNFIYRLYIVGLPEDE